jgi:hypothetical protein
MMIFTKEQLAVSITIACTLGATLLAGRAAADQVIPDDLIVQGSTCIGLDCVVNMTFGSDTLVLRENQLRIFFQDTSVGSFPTNDWRFIANGAETANFFSLQDEGVGGAFRQVFRFDSGAQSNAFRMDQSSRAGFGTGTPAQKIHMNTSDTPTVRMEQNGGGGFTAQTWDVGANEANFFVRDLTGGSRLPFRVRPGAPTSSVDISANGNVGVGTASPVANVDVVSTTAQAVGRLLGNTGGILEMSDSNAAADKKNYQVRSQGDVFKLTLLNDARNAFIADNIVVATSTGSVGIGTVPAQRFHTIGNVRFAGVASCGSGIVSNASGDLSCLASSRTVKNIAGELPTQTALANVMALRPQTGAYKETPDVPEHWLIAEEVASVDPALVGLHEGKPHVVKTQNVVADLVAVVQQQQREIDELKRLLAAK